MIWGGFTATYKLSLIQMPPNRCTSVDYVEIVYDGVLGSFLKEQEGVCKVVLMEDGAPVHRGKVAKDWRENHDLKKIEWPAQSPNLNPIENVWKLLKDVVQKRRRSKNQEDMWLVVESEWKTISQSKLEALVATIPQRIKDVIVVGSGSIH
jgi:transposase